MATKSTIDPSGNDAGVSNQTSQILSTLEKQKSKDGSSGYGKTPVDGGKPKQGKGK